MEALRDVHLKIGGRSRRLLDEVDVINAVSGGSIVAGYYAVHREGLFRDFESRFLKRDVERQIRAEVLANLPRLAQRRFSRGELLAEYFDRELFDGATYSDLARGSMRPYVVINASALATGARFPFTQAQFDLLCSDLGSVPVGRAVAASAALPPFFGPITLDSFAGTCGPVSLPGIDSTSPTRVVRLEEARTYLDRSRRPHVHLVDGGLIDNLGLRVAGDFAVEHGGFFELVDALGYRDVSHVVFISVNAETASNHAIDQTSNTPNFLQTLNALKLPGSAHSSEVAEQLRASFEGWRDEVRRARKRAGDDGGEDIGPQFYFIDISLQGIPDEAERNTFQTIPTALTLDAATVDRLRAVARKQLLASPELKKLAADLGN
jgi:NTE family protein